MSKFLDGTFSLIMLAMWEDLAYYRPMLKNLKQKTKGFRKLAQNPLYVFEYLKKGYYCLRGTDQFTDFYKKLDIKSKQETVDILLTDRPSFARIGDGEMEIIRGGSIYFGSWHQKYDPTLQKRLIEILKNPDIQVGIMKEQITENDKTLKDNGQFYTWLQMRYALHRYTNPKKTYLHLTALRNNENLDVGRLFEFFRSQNIILVTGDKNAHNLLSTALPSIDYIKVPSVDAWSNYEKIITGIDRHIAEHSPDPTSTLFLISAGPAAKPLVVDLTERGFTAWDTGHFFMQYDEEIKKLSNAKP